MLEGSLFFCMCMVRGGGDILFRALNTSGTVRKKMGGWIFGRPRRGVHCFQTLKGGKHLFILH